MFYRINGKRRFFLLIRKNDPTRDSKHAIETLLEKSDLPVLASDGPVIYSISSRRYCVTNFCIKMAEQISDSNRDSVVSCKSRPLRLYVEEDEVCLQSV